MQNLIQYISEYNIISNELKEDIYINFELINIEKGSLLLKEGTKPHYLYFIEKGALHNYYIYNGKQISSWFYFENQFITAWSGFYMQKASFETIECLEDCILYRISYEKYQKLITKHSDFGNFARQLAEKMLVAIDEFSISWSFLSAKEKYNSLKINFPQIETRIKLGLIASFLGITQETLSRIRAEK